MGQGQDKLFIRDVEAGLPWPSRSPRAPVTTLDMIQEESTYHTKNYE